jgi:hypothetical protein
MVKLRRMNGKSRPIWVGAWSSIGNPFQTHQLRLLAACFGPDLLPFILISWSFPAVTAILILIH